MSDTVSESPQHRHPRTLLGRIGHLVVLGRPRTWFFSYFACLAGFALGPSPPSPTVVAASLVLCSLWTAATNQLNAYTDRDEDAINLPDRVSLVECVGATTLRNVSLASFVVVVVGAFVINPVFGGVMTLAVLDSYFYSMPPLRLKARPLGSLLAFSGAFGFPLAGGYLLASSTVTVPPIVWIMTYWFFTYGAVKNLPDYHGDKEAGLRTPATIFETQYDAILFAGLLLLSPFPIIAGAALTGVVATKYLWLLAFVPFLLWILRRSLRSDSDEELEIAHTEGFFYAVAMAAGFLLLHSRTVETLALAAAPFGVLFAIQTVGLDSR